jgi:lipopolysaccharide heptosyltransferase II
VLADDEKATAQIPYSIPRRHSVTSPKILLLRLSSLGDIVLTTALITALRERYPESRIDLVIASEYESIVSVLPDVSRVHVFNKSTGLKGLRALRRSLKNERYDYVLDLHNVLRTRILRRGLGKHISVIDKRTFRRWMLVRFKRDFLKVAPDVIGRYFETAKALKVVDDGRPPKLKATHERNPKRIAVAPGARHWNKRWPAEYYRDLAQTLLDKGYEVVFYGSRADVETIEQIRNGLTGNHRSLADETTITEAAHSLAKCAAAITNDSGLMHIAQAVGTPVVTLFGPTVQRFGFAPRTANSVVLEVKGLYCRPCTAIGLDHCPEKHFRCMREITPEQVLVTLSNTSLKTTG